MSLKMRSLLAGAALVFAGSAVAAPPAVTGSAIVVPLDVTSSTFLVNLRAQGVISGTAPLNVTPGAVTIPGDPVTVFRVDRFAGAASTSTVCLSVTGQIPAQGTQANVELTVSNPQGVSDGPRTIPITIGPGPVFGPNDAAAIQACSDPHVAPTANAGVDQSLADTEGQAGENVVLDARTSTDAGGTITSYEWTIGDGVSIATGINPTVRLPDGISQVTLTVTDDSGDSDTNTAQDTVVITVAATRAPTANAGGNRTVADTDKVPGERVRLDGSASTDPDGTLVAYEWFSAQETSLGTGAILQGVALPDGDNLITLVVRDNVGNTASNTATITVGTAPTRPTLADLPNLTPNQRSMAVALDDLCLRLAERNQQQQDLAADQSDLLARCNGIVFDPTQAQQVVALDELGAQDFNAIRTQALVFSQFQNMGVMDRLIALRGGARGLSLAGLTLNVDGKAMPLGAIEDAARSLFGGGASADEPEPGGLFADRWGLWARGNVSFGDKSATAADRGFDADQWGLTAGVDYRLSDRVVVGGAAGFGRSNISFNPSGRGGLDTSAWTVSAYGSAYALGNLYVDGSFSYSRTDYDAERHIRYTDATGLVDRTARGSTAGNNLSAAFAVGYDLVASGLTVSPNVGFLYIDSTVDSFEENGASGLDLAFDEQKFASATANVGVRVNYAWNASWGVLLPHLRGDLVREFRDNVEVFGVRFVNDPFANAANPTPPIVIRSDTPDKSYFRFAAGVSAQFRYGLSGYAEYQRLAGFDALTFSDVTLGLRIQRSFQHTP